MLRKYCICIIMVVFSLIPVEVLFADEANENRIKYKYEISSNFYKEPYGVMAAFDEDETNYTAAYNNTFPNWFIVIVDKPVLAENIQIQWLNSIDYATDFEIFGYSNNEWVLLAKETNYKIGVNTFQYKKNISNPITINKIKFVVYKTNGQQRLLIRKFELNAGYYGKSYESVSEVVNEVLIGIGKNTTSHQKIMLFMDWIDDNIRAELGKGDVLYTINYKVGACGSLSQLLIAMANEIGLEARPINLYNYPKPGLGHSLVEIKWDNKWHLYDPTYQACYLNKSSDLANQINPDVASFEEIRRNPEIVDKNRIVLNVKRLYRGLSIEKGDGDRIVEPRGVYTSSDAYRESEPAGPIGPDKPMIFPASFDLSNGSMQYGEKNFKDDDMGNIYKVPQALYMIGVSYHNVNHKYLLQNLVIGKRYKLEIGIIYSLPDIFELSVEGDGVKLEGNDKIQIVAKDRKDAEVLEIPFIAENENASIQLLHDYSERSILSIDFIRILEVQ